MSFDSALKLSRKNLSWFCKFGYYILSKFADVYLHLQHIVFVPHLEILTITNLFKTLSFRSSERSYQRQWWLRYNTPIFFWFVAIKFFGWKISFVWKFFHKRFSLVNNCSSLIAKRVKLVKLLPTNTPTISSCITKEMRWIMDLQVTFLLLTQIYFQVKMLYFDFLWFI